MLRNTNEDADLMFSHSSEDIIAGAEEGRHGVLTLNMRASSLKDAKKTEA